MTFPQQAGVNVPAILFPVTSSGLADKQNLTQDVATAALTQEYVTDNPGIQNPMAQVFSGVSGGLMGALKMIVGKLTGQTPGDGASMGGVLGLLGRVPFLGDLISAFQNAGSGNSTGSGSNSGNPLGFVTGWLSNLLAMLGNPSGIGSGGGTSPPDENGGGTVIPGTFDPDAALGKLATKLIGAGVLTSNTPIPPNLLTALTPGTSNNLLPDASFVDQNAVKGNGLWVYDWPGKGSTTWGTSGCVRTKRTETITIFWCGGTWEQNPGANLWAWPDPGTYLKKLSSNITLNGDATAEVIGENLLDWTHFDVINVPYEGALYPMGESLAQGATAVINLIKQIPGKFILMGLSQGAGVMSNVYDEIRHGSLQSRNADMLMGFAFGNIRRQKDRSFPGAPNYTPAGGYGVFPTTLTDTEDRWWEWALEAGTYPAYDQPNGITFTTGDPYAALGNTTAAETGLRQLVAQTGAAMTYNPIEFYLLLASAAFTNPGFALVSAANTILGTPHSDSHYLVQPFLADGDHRTYWQIVVDKINSLADQVSPPLEGMRHQLEGIQVAVQPLQVVVAGASVQWINVVADGPAIMVGVNAYGPETKDAFGNTIPGQLITGPDHPTISVIADDAIITDPGAESGGWVDLEASFVMPPGAATARLVFAASPEAMTTGTVWFDEGKIEVSALIDAALLDNIQALNVPGANVTGPQGIADMLTAYQNLIDGVASAATQNEMTGTQLGALFEALGQKMLDAQTALELSISQQQQLANNSVQPMYNGLQPTGEVTFPLGSTPLKVVTVAAGDTIAGYINCAQVAKKGFIEFVARCTGTGAYLNAYKVDPASGNWTQRLWSSSDVSDEMGSTLDWISQTLPGAQEILVAASDLVALELVAEGAAVDVVCSNVVIDDSGATVALPDHPSAMQANFGVGRTTAASGGISPATVDSSALTFSNTEPFFCFGVVNVPPDYQPPDYWSKKTAGTYTYTIPSWVEAGDRLDFALDGGGAGGETAGFGAIGFGGQAGKQKFATLVYGTDIPLTTHTLTVVVGAGGAANADGTASSVSGTGVSTLTAAGGKTAQAPNEKGQGADDQTWQGRRYFAGHEVAAGQAGAKPSGGGGGGSSGLFGIIGAMPTGPGAEGYVSITVRQS